MADGASPKRWRKVRGYDKPIHGSCGIYFPGGIYIVFIFTSIPGRPFKIYVYLECVVDDSYFCKNLELRVFIKVGCLSNILKESTPCKRVQ